MRLIRDYVFTGFAGYLWHVQVWEHPTGERIKTTRLLLDTNEEVPVQARTQEAGHPG